MAGLVALAATILLSGCIQITGLTATQPGTVGPIRLSHDLCFSSSAECQMLSAEVPEGQVQALAAYRVPSWAPDPTSVQVRIGAQTVAMVLDPSYAEALLTARPGLARPGERWVAYRAATGQPALAKDSTPTAKLEATFDLPDGDARLFSHLTVVGFRWLTLPGSPGVALSPTRAHVCGLPIPAVVGATALTDSACTTGFWPRTDGTDVDPTDNGSEFLTRNRLQLTAAGEQQVLPGQRAQFSFGAAGVATLAGTSVPVTASTTVPGATVSAPASLVLAPAGAVPVQVDVPSSTPPGDYEVSVFVGSSTEGRRAVATLRVLPLPTTPTPTPSSAPGVAPAPTPAPSATPGGPSTFAESVSAAAAALGAPGARDALRRGRLRIKVRASAKGRVAVEFRQGKLLVAKGTRATRRKGFVTVKLKLTKAGSSALSGRDALSGTLRVRFAPVKGKAATTSLPVTIPAS